MCTILFLECFPIENVVIDQYHVGETSSSFHFIGRQNNLGPSIGWIKYFDGRFTNVMVDHVDVGAKTIVVCYQSFIWEHISIQARDMRIILDMRSFHKVDGLTIPMMLIRYEDHLCRHDHARALRSFGNYYDNNLALNFYENYFI